MGGGQRCSVHVSYGARRLGNQDYDNKTKHSFFVFFFLTVQIYCNSGKHCKGEGYKKKEKKNLKIDSESEFSSSVARR